MMNTVELARQIENSIRLTLLAARFRDLPDYTVPRLFVYDHVMKTHGKHGIITTGFFSRIIADMKKTGIIGTAKGGEVLFLTEAYWKLSGGEAQLNEFKKQREQLATEVLRHLEAASRTRDYFRTEQFTIDFPVGAKVKQSEIDNVLQFFIERGDIEYDGEQYRLSNKTRAEITASVESAPQEAGA